MASWSAIEATLPSSDMVANQEAVLDHVRQRHFIEPEWRSVKIQHPTDPLVYGIVRVMSDALRLGEPGDSVRVTVSHRTQQAIADLLGLRMLTARVADHRDNFSVPKIEPQFLSTEGAPSDVAHMVKHSQAIDVAAGPNPLTIGTPGKLWINSRRLANPSAERWGKKTAINYGGYTKAPATPQGKVGPKLAASGGKRNVWQEPGGAHDVDHVDESQTALFMQPDMTIIWGEAGESWDVDDVAVNPQLWPILSHEGPIAMRHPWLAPCLSLADGGSCAPVGGPVPPAIGGVSTGKRLAAAGGVVGAAAFAAWAVWRWL